MFEKIKSEIISQSEDANTEDAVKQLANMWEQINRLSELAEARLRLLIPSVSRPKEKWLPAWSFLDVKETYHPSVLRSVHCTSTASALAWYLCSCL